MSLSYIIMRLVKFNIQNNFVSCNYIRYLINFYFNDYFIKNQNINLINFFFCAIKKYRYID